MKKSTKSSLIIFIVTLIVAYVMTCFIPDEVLTYATINGSLLSFLGDGVAKLVGMRAIISVAVALIVVLLIRIVDTDEKTKKVEGKTTKKPVAKKSTNTSKKGN